MNTISVLFIVAVLLAFLAGLELGRWYRRVLNALGAVQRELRRIRLERVEQVTVPAKDTSPGVAVPSHYPEPIDLEEETGGVMPISPARVAAEEAAAAKRR